MEFTINKHVNYRSFYVVWHMAGICLPASLRRRVSCFDVTRPPAISNVIIHCSELLMGYVLDLDIRPMLGDVLYTVTIVYSCMKTREPLFTWATTTALNPLLFTALFFNKSRKFLGLNLIDHFNLNTSSKFIECKYVCK